jgi:Protein of unknown function (DUF1488)
MKIYFIGPARIGENKAILYPASLDSHPLECVFSYEALEDIDPDSILGDPLEHFAKHQLKLLSIAEQKILNGHAHNGKVEIYSSDLVAD